MRYLKVFCACCDRECNLYQTHNYHIRLVSDCCLSSYYELDDDWTTESLLSDYGNTIDDNGRYGYRSWEDNNTGGQVEVTRWRDGSSTVHHGGPCGPMSYNKYGEEC